MGLLILIIFAYMLGSVPFGLIVSKTHGIDLRNIGSGNIGATNLSRALGRKWGYVCFGLDTAKGLIPMMIAGRFVSSPPSTAEFFLWLAVGFAAVTGHIFPVYLKFRGGKGVATSFGVALGLWPYYTVCALISLVIWVSFVLIWRYVSLSSIAASVAFPAALAVATAATPSWQITELWPLFTAAAVIPLMVIFRHRENIKRILAGTEGKVLSKKHRPQ